MIEWYKIGQSDGMQGSLLLNATSEVQLGGGRRHSFTISTDGVTLALAASTDREIVDWIDCVRMQLQMQQEPPRPLSPVPAELRRPSFVDDDEEDGDDDPWEEESEDPQGAKSFSEV